ncbi:MAG: flagellar hook-length control protein FliK, partial [Nitrospirae bacterium]|nr:flagellar hook-length control protein FliK [Nitrospirota bacterium]
GGDAPEPATARGAEPSQARGEGQRDDAPRFGAAKGGRFGAPEGTAPAAPQAAPAPADGPRLAQMSAQAPVVPQAALQAAPADVAPKADAAGGERGGPVQGIGPAGDGAPAQHVKDAGPLHRAGHPARAEAFDQVIDRTLRMVRVGDREATLQLTPEHLGELKIRVVVEGGMVSAHLTVHNAQTRDLIGDQLGRLEQALRDAGADGAQVDVGLNEGNGKGQREQADGQPAQRQATVPKPADGPGRPVVVPAGSSLSIHA